MKEIKSPSDLTVTSIQALYDRLKKDRKILNWAEFAEKIDKDRTYMSRIMNGHEPLTETVRNAIYSTFVNSTAAVVSVQQTSQPLELAGLRLTVGDYIDEIKQTRAFAQRMLESGMKELEANLKTANAVLLALQTSQAAQHDVMLESLERIEKSKKGALVKEADRRQKELNEQLLSKGKTDDKLA